MYMVLMCPVMGKGKGKPPQSKAMLYFQLSDPLPKETIHSQEYWVVAGATWLNCDKGFASAPE